MLTSAKLTEASAKLKTVLMYDANIPPVLEDSVEAALSVLAALAIGSLIDENLFAQAQDNGSLEPFVDEIIEALTTVVQNSGVIEGYEEVI